MKYIEASIKRKMYDYIIRTLATTPSPVDLSMKTSSSTLSHSIKLPPPVKEFINQVVLILKIMGYMKISLTQSPCIWRVEVWRLQIQS